MRINDDIGDYTFGCEGYVLLRNNHSYYAFLAMTRSKFVAEFWNSLVAHSGFHKFASFTGFSDEKGVYNSLFRRSQVH